MTHIGLRYVQRTVLKFKVRSSTLPSITAKFFEVYMTSVFNI